MTFWRDLQERCRMLFMRHPPTKYSTKELPLSVAQAIDAVHVTYRGEDEFGERFLVDFPTATPFIFNPDKSKNFLRNIYPNLNEQQLAVADRLLRLRVIGARHGRHPDSQRRR